jgi:HAD superfamily hydrolase (TIGR01459 family)
MSVPGPADPREVPGLEALAERFDAFLVDQFGVLIGGNGAYPWAPESLSRLSAGGAPVVLLSNSGRRAGPNVERLLRLGFARDSFITVLSSGEAAHADLSRRIGPQIAPGAPVLVLARENDVSAVEGLDLRVTTDPDRAALIVLAGSEGDRHSLDHYRALLEGPAARGVPCLCTNPDVTMLTPEGTSFGAGRIAQLYAHMGGPVDWVGKPHPLIYDVARRMLPAIAPERVLCIGDSPAHDVRGGQAAGHATALVRSGIHADLDKPALRALCVAEGAVPDYLLDRFAFSS